MTIEQYRKRFNIKCCDLIKTILTEYPFLRFGQLMSNLYSDDEMFYEEPLHTYKRLENYYNKLKKTAV